ncbi:Membrane protein involved in the export of O-antigen and teichoic acid [Clostridium sp. USBA 49]|jgi:O-antigen/teichoic acid export membrane protein|uniref:oligosaccharide flippase family protein n=1 Tax=Clostridium TaxID=1485 RepID=UPI000999BE2D|nr:MULTISPECIES: oligosaccharide flippase family protein [Clostridium]SKA88218.1 Membrane protein involved in the export of O-antigen and teichoic acid [Clostridium sp. USBA 49]
MKFFKSTVLTFISNIFGFGISMITTILLSRLLGASGKGVIGVSNNIIAFSMLILGLGFEAANIFFVGKDKKNINNILGYNLIICGFSFIILLIIASIHLVHPINFIFKGIDNRIIILLLFIIPMSLMKSSLINLILGLQDIVRFNKINVLDKIITFILMLISLLVFNSPLYIIFSTLLSTLIIQLILIYIVIVKYNVKPSFNFVFYKKMIGYGAKSQISNTIQMINYRLDVFIINYFLELSQVAIYQNAVSLGEALWQVSGTISTIVFPMTSNSKNIEELKGFINRVSRVTLFFIVICSIFLSIISKPLIIFLFGKEFTDAYIALILLLPGISFFSVSKILANFLAGVGKTEKNIISSSISGITTIILDLILIPRIGINGAAIASSISYIVFTLTSIYFYSRYTKSSFKSICVITKEDMSFIYTEINKFINRKIRKKING